MSFIYCNFTTWSFQSNQKLSTAKEAVRLCGIPNNPWDDHDQLPFEVYIIIIYSEVKFPYIYVYFSNLISYHKFYMKNEVVS